MPSKVQLYTQMADRTAEQVTGSYQKFLTLKKQMEAAAPLAPDGTLQVDASVPERAEYEQQIEVLQDGKRTLYERYLMGDVYKRQTIGFPLMPLVLMPVFTFLLMSFA